MERKDNGNYNKQTGPILFASVRAKRMGDRFAHLIKFYLHRHNYKNCHPSQSRGQLSEYSLIGKPCSIPWSVCHPLGLVLCFRSDGYAPTPRQPHRTKVPLSSLPEHRLLYMSNHLSKSAVS